MREQIIIRSDASSTRFEQIVIGIPGSDGPAGPEGVSGDDGRTILSGSGGPDSGLGTDGDFYIDNDAVEIYGPKTGGEWPASTSLVGPQGAQGPAGEQGPQGLQGIQGEQGPIGAGLNILGTLASTAELPVSGEVGDAYLIDGDLHVWDSIAWQNVGHIQGPQGEVGPAGLQGEAGPQGIQGVVGPEGPQGIQGETGAAGPAGTTDYELLDNKPNLDLLIPLSQKGAASGVAPLGSDNALPEANFPRRLRDHAGGSSDAVADWNSITANGWYRGSGTALNAPEAIAFLGKVSSYASTFTLQELVGMSALGTTDRKHYRRLMLSGTWQAWERVWETEAELDARFPTKTSLFDGDLIKSELLPVSGSYKGTWNAATNTPTITSSTGTNGDFYIVGTAGTTSIDGTASWAIGDQIRFNGTAWQKIASNQAVSTVNGQTADVLINWGNLPGIPATFPPEAHSHTVSDISDFPDTLPPDDDSVTLAKLAADALAAINDKVSLSAAGVQVVAGAVVPTLRGIKITEFLAKHNGDNQLAFNEAITKVYTTTSNNLDMEGMRLTIAPSNDIAAITGVTSYAQDHGIINGQIQVTGAGTVESPPTRSCTITAGSHDITMVSTDNLKVGMRIRPAGSLDGQDYGRGIGREVYIEEVVDATTIRMNCAAYASASGFLRFDNYPFVLDFIGMTQVQRLRIQGIYFILQAQTSGVRLPQAIGLRFIGNWVNQPAMFGLAYVTGSGGCEINDNQFASFESAIDPSLRVSIAISLGEMGDMKIRNNRVYNFKHALFTHGHGQIIMGNHFWQGTADTVNRTASIVLANRLSKTAITGQYIDNSWIEITDENGADEGPALGYVGITGGVFTLNSDNDGFHFIRLRPFHANKPAGAITVTGNVFRVIGTAGTEGLVSIERVEDVITTDGTINTDEMDQVWFAHNVFIAVDIWTQNPATMRREVTTGTNQNIYMDFSILPFGGKTKHITSIAGRRLRNGSDAEHFPVLYGLAAGDTNPGDSTVLADSKICIRQSIGGRGIYVATVDCNKTIQAAAA